MLLLLASLMAGRLAAVQAEQAARAGSQRLLTQFAIQVNHGLEANLQTRLAIVQASADQLAASGELGPPALRRHLDVVRTRFPEFVWLGVVDAAGKVVAATEGLLQGENIAQRPWVTAGRAGAYLGELHPAVLLADHLPRSADGRSLRIIDVAAPIHRGNGDVRGVVGAYLSWHWIERLRGELQSALDTDSPLELLLVARDGTVLAGAPAWLGRPAGAGADLTERGRYVVGRHDAGRSAGSALGWSIVVRQSSEAALRQAQALGHAVLLTVLAAGLLAALAALALTHWLTLRLGGLSAQAHAIREGRRSSIEVPPGRDEISAIGATMAALVGQLQHEKSALATLNAELDARVAERSARIERMAEAARYAAVTRERLRLARDLHDTLAHSLMALLQQIRLVRKLRARLAPDELAAELGRAEEVAARGLGEARAAITQMRHGGVRDSGLAAALRDALARFAERTGLQTSFAAAGAAVDLADERAETLYRIVEECLRNIERHAGASCVALTLGASGPRARLGVRDDGVGFDTAAARPGHYGMLGMREQAALIGATLAVDSRPGAGTEVQLEFEP
ncbi:MAG: hypothetical protein JSR43_01630 [Proteobacteria bacterium]|nr:hypothetical protein [Pseudomonadota bacterium]HOL36270.1 histidine kinase [Rubrivivax sp.]